MSVVIQWRARCLMILKKKGEEKKNALTQMMRKYCNKQINKKKESEKCLNWNFRRFGGILCFRNITFHKMNVWKFKMCHFIVANNPKVFYLFVCKFGCYFVQHANWTEETWFLVGKMSFVFILSESTTRSQQRTQTLQASC